MVASLKKQGIIYRCSNCMMRQPTPLEPSCPFCGEILSNWESIAIEEFKENEENVRRGDREPHCFQS